jgi:hypothetical protein
VLWLRVIFVQARQVGAAVAVAWHPRVVPGGVLAELKRAGWGLVAKAVVPGQPVASNTAVGSR